jgi:Transglycosylase
MGRPATTPPGARARVARAGAERGPGAKGAPGAVDNRGRQFRGWATLPFGGPIPRWAGFRRARCVALPLPVGCLSLAGSVSVRPLELAPPHRVAQTSLVLDAKGRRLAALHGAGGPHGGAAVEGEPVDAAGRGRHRGHPVLAARRGGLAGRGQGGGRRPGAGAGGGGGRPDYFSTRAERLGLAQAALLAGLIRAPAASDPFRHPRAARARRAEVLARLARQGHLRPAARVRGAAAPLGLRPGRAQPRAPRAPWFVGWVLDQLLDPADHRFGALGTSRRARTDMVLTGGLRMVTTVDLEGQVTAERAVAAVAGRRGGDPYGALVAVAPGTGAVQAMVGGRDGLGDARLRPGQPGHRRGRRRPVRRLRVQDLRPGGGPERGIPPEAVFAPRTGWWWGGGAGARPGGGQLRGPRLRPGDPADGHRPVDQHRVRRAAAPPGRGRRRPRSAGGGRGGPADGGGQPAAAGAERRARHRRGDPAGDGLGLRHPGRQGRRAAPFGVRQITGPDGRVLYQARQRAGGAAGGGRDRRRRAARGGRPRHRRPRPDRPAGGGQDRHHPGPRRRLAGPAGSRTGRSRAWSRRWSGCRWRGPRLAVGGRAVAASGCGWTTPPRPGPCRPSRRPAGPPGRPGRRSS